LQDALDCSIHRAYYLRMTIRNEPLIAACKEVGGQAAMADKLDVTRQSVNYWCLGTIPVPWHAVLKIEAMMQRRITRYELAPLIYPRDYIGC